MHITQQQEQLSRAYVHALATMVGCTIAPPAVDDDSVDLIVVGRISGPVIRAPRLDLQLKATTQEDWHDDHLSFSLKKKNYDELRGDDFLVPRILVVLCLPKNPENWVEQDEQGLILHGHAYWLSLRELPERPEIKDSVTVRIPRENQFTVATLAAIIERIANGEVP